MSRVNPADIIPHGPYCYTRLYSTDSLSGVAVPCPYWATNRAEHYQDNGYCFLLGVGDWEGESVDLLWDSIKACGINEDYDDGEE